MGGTSGRAVRKGDVDVLTRTRTGSRTSSSKLRSESWRLWHIGRSCGRGCFVVTWYYLYLSSTYLVTEEYTDHRCYSFRTEWSVVVWRSLLNVQLPIGRLLVSCRGLPHRRDQAFLANRPRQARYPCHVPYCVHMGRSCPFATTGGSTVGQSKSQVYAVAMFLGDPSSVISGVTGPRDCVGCHQWREVEGMHRVLDMATVCWLPPIRAPMDDSDRCRRGGKWGALPCQPPCEPPVRPMSDPCLT